MLTDRTAMRPFSRLLTVLALIGALCHVNDSDAQYSYQAEVYPLTPLRSPKPMMSELVRTIGVIDVSHDHETRSLQFTSPTTVSLQQLRSLVQPHGFYVLRINDGRQGESDVRSLDPNYDLFPTKYDTGNEIEDNSRYETAKAQWIEAHPLEYDALVNGEHPVTKDSDK